MARPAAEVETARQVTVAVYSLERARPPPRALRSAAMGRKERLLIEVSEYLKQLHAEEPRPSFDEA